MDQLYDKGILEASLSQMEAAALNFAQRNINDGMVRLSYINQTRKLSQEYRAKVKAGGISAEEAAKQVQSLRNEILKAQRMRSSDIGRARAIKLKKSALTLDDLTSKYAQQIYRKPFSGLTVYRKNTVYLEIIDSSGRPRPSVNAAARRYTALGRGLLLVTIGAAVYNIATAEDKVKATTREGVVLGGGFAGGAAGGALSGLACGPGAPVCVTVGVFIGGALGALGADVSFGWFLR